MTATTLTQNHTNPLFSRNIPVPHPVDNRDESCFLNAGKISPKNAYLAANLGALFVFVKDEVSASDGDNTFYKWRQGDSGFIFGLCFDGTSYFLSIGIGSAFTDCFEVHEIPVSEIHKHIVMIDHRGSKLPFPDYFFKP